MWYTICERSEHDLWRPRLQAHRMIKATFSGQLKNPAQLIIQTINLTGLFCFRQAMASLNFIFYLKWIYYFLDFFFLTLWLSHAQAALLHCSETLINPSIWNRLHQRRLGERTVFIISKFGKNPSSLCTFRLRGAMDKADNLEKLKTCWWLSPKEQQRNCHDN